MLAYLDAGTGSVILQVIVGGVAAFAVAMRMFWGRVLTILRIRRPEPEALAETEQKT